MESVNPANGETIKTYEPMTDDAISSIIDGIGEGQQAWAGHSFSDRAAILKKSATLLKDRKDELAELMAREMGKPLDQGVSEAEKCAWVCEYYAEHAESFLADESIDSDASNSYVHFEPMGVVMAIMPWNFPFWQLFRFVAPALMAGNGAVLKHASNVTGCALKIEDILHEAGVPKNVFRTLVAGSEQAEKAIEHPQIKAVTLTGSTGAGIAVAKKAGSELKKTVLELGGSDPYVILEDADIENAAEQCVASRLQNTGQSCIAAKRFIVVKEVYDAFVDAVMERMKAKNVGNPLEDDDIDLGPMAREDLRDELHEQVQESMKKGAQCILGGSIPERDGAYYLPTLLVNVEKGMPAYDQELFGPVASVIKVKDEAEAIAVANDTDFGLGAAVFSEDLERAQHIAATKLKAGCCFVNEYVKSDPRLPFGGVKKSGYGRELSQFGIREFVNTKTVYVA